MLGVHSVHSWDLLSIVWNRRFDSDVFGSSPVSPPGAMVFSRIALSGVSSEAATWRLSHDKRNQKFFQWQLNVEVLVTWQVPSPNDEKLPEPLLLYWISLQRYGVARYLSPNICHVHCPTSMPQFLQYSCGRCAPEICIFLDLGKARTGTGPKSQTPQWFSVSKMPSNGG